MKKMDGDKDGRVSFADYSEMVSLCLTIVCVHYHPTFILVMTKTRMNVFLFLTTQ